MGDKHLNTQQCTEALQKEIGKIMVGKQEQIQLILLSVFSGGHILLDDLPGSGKTTLIRTLSLALGCDYRRIQFTPDLLPSDILGMTIYDQKTGEFVLRKGPVDTNILLADEINRAIPRTQSALLEAMEERQITIDGQTFKLPEPFLVMATQNPVERESTFQLPAAQMDRFFIRLSLGYPDVTEEMDMLDKLGDGIPFDQIQAVTSPEELMHLRDEIQQVTVSQPLMEYMVQLVHATRSHPMLKAGASPRASRTLFQGVKAAAAMEGRTYAIPEDVRKLALPVLSHRVVLTGEARYSRKAPEEIIMQILSELPVPPAHKDWVNGNYEK